MNLFILGGLILWVGAIVVLLLGLVVLLVTAYVKRSRKLALWSTGGTVGAILLVSGVFVAISYFWFRPYEPTTTAELRQAYSADFGNLPPAGITVLKCRQVIVGDSGGQWLLLQATPEEIERHIAMGFTKVEQTPAVFNGGSGANAPEWWAPPTARLEFFENKDWTKAGGWHSSEAVMGVDRASNVVWFAASKWD